MTSADAVDTAGRQPPARAGAGTGTGAGTGGTASGAFSVLLPVYWGDRPDQVEAAFRSVTAAQELAPAQVVVVRDGPVGPALADWLGATARRPEVTLVTLAAGRGLGGALNAGLDACRFDVVARQDADDVSAPARFRLMTPLVESGQFDLVGSAMREFTADAGGVSPGRVRRYPLTEAEIRRVAKLMNPFAHPTVVMRRSRVLAAGGYRDFHHLEDYDLWVRLLAGGAKVANLPQPLVDYRVSDGGWRRRGGAKTLRAEFALQRAFREAGFVTRGQRLRNLALRGGLELAPPAALRAALSQVWR
ncbi:MAG: glycosyltransferase [Bifidobacteriaceae bacterium]|jgi:glycosyltransferase involved in cell wall biosynthesis|nr:glycosyltransferase [Bifidobacteriaceae bacterium]